MPNTAISRSASRLVWLNAVRSWSAAPGIEIWTRRIARPLPRIARNSRSTKSRCTALVSLPGPSCSTPRQLTTRSISCSPISRASAAVSIDITGISRSSALARCDGCVSPRDPDHLKTSHAQIVGDEPPDQAGGAEHQNLSRFAHTGLLELRLGDHQPENQP